MFFEYFIVKTRGESLIRNCQFHLKICIVLIGIFISSASYGLDWTFESSSFSKSYSKLLEDRAEKAGKRVSLLWNLESEADSYSSSIDNYFYFQFKGVGKLRYKLLKQLTLNLKANVLFQGGQAQSRFGDLLPSGPAYLSYGYINYDVLGDERIAIQAGALSQFEVFGNNVFISNRAFPGVGESVTILNEDWFLRLRAQQVVPTTYTFSTSLVERESTPTLSSANVDLSYQFEDLKLGLMAGVFDYGSLPAAVANSSRLYGNTVQGTGFASQFIFDYRGWLVNLEGIYNLSKDTSFRALVSMLENLGAPSTYNQSQVIQLSAHHRLNRDFGFDIVLSDFFIESDAVPAFFTSRSLGQTNRKGFAVEAGFQWVEKKIRLSAGYAISDLINPDPGLRQLDNDIITLNLETAYDIFN